jgi:Zn finger protein HypA/HybF involved in hydrogenase expression
MQSIASLAIEQARELFEQLQKNAIPAELRTATQENGLETGDILVEDAHYDRACDIAEAWDAERQEAAERRSNRRCPKCGSLHLEYVPHDKLDYVYRCKDCGSEVVY